MVGYDMVIYDYDLDEYDIRHRMIDATEQGKGYGKAAFAKVLDYIRTKPLENRGRVVLTCNRDNEGALRLYCSYGFVSTGNAGEDEDKFMLIIGFPRWI